MDIIGQYTGSTIAICSRGICAVIIIVVIVAGTINVVAAAANVHICMWGLLLIFTCRRCGSCRCRCCVCICGYLRVFFHVALIKVC